MDKILDKLSSYNLVNYLLPGAIFFYFVSFVTVTPVDTNLMSLLFVYYFIGMTISRIGSLLLVPFFKKINIIQYVPYEDYLAAVEINKKIEILSEHNNMFRTFTSVFFLLFAYGILILVIDQSYFLWRWILFYLFMFVLMLFSWQKQTKFITRSINAALKKT